VCSLNAANDAIVTEAAKILSAIFLINLGVGAQYELDVILNFIYY